MTGRGDLPLSAKVAALSKIPYAFGEVLAPLISLGVDVTGAEAAVARDGQTRVMGGSRRDRHDERTDLHPWMAIAFRSDVNDAAQT